VKKQNSGKEFSGKESERTVIKILEKKNKAANSWGVKKTKLPDRLPYIILYSIMEYLSLTEILSWEGRISNQWWALIRKIQKKSVPLNVEYLWTYAQQFGTALWKELLRPFPYKDQENNLFYTDYGDCPHYSEEFYHQQAITRFINALSNESRQSSCHRICHPNILHLAQTAIRLPAIRLPKFIEWYCDHEVDHLVEIMIHQGSRAMLVDVLEHEEEKNQAAKALENILNHLRRPGRLPTRTFAIRIKYLFIQARKIRENKYYAPVFSLLRHLIQDKSSTKQLPFLINQIDQVSPLQECRHFVKQASKLSAPLVELSILYNLMRTEMGVNDLNVLTDRIHYLNLPLSSEFYCNYIDYQRAVGIFFEWELYATVLANPNLTKYILMNNEQYLIGLLKKVKGARVFYRILEHNPQLPGQLPADLWLKAAKKNTSITKAIFEIFPNWENFTSVQRYHLLKFHCDTTRIFYDEHTIKARQFLREMEDQDLLSLMRDNHFCCQNELFLFVKNELKKRIPVFFRLHSWWHSHARSEVKNRIPLIESKAPLLFERVPRSFLNRRQQWRLVGAMTLGLLALAACLTGVGMIVGGAATVALGITWLAKLYLTHKVLSVGTALGITLFSAYGSYRCAKAFKYHVVNRKPAKDNTTKFFIHKQL